jgi:hypothetical protein
MSPNSNATHALPPMTMRPTSASGLALILWLKRMCTASACAERRVAVREGVAVSGRDSGRERDGGAYEGSPR